MRTKLYAPEIDAILGQASHGQGFVNHIIYLKLKEIYTVFSRVKPVGDDDIRHIWLEVERGGIKAFGDYADYKESSEVENEEGFEELWKDYYPSETKWYKFQTSKYKDDLFFYFEDKLFCSININEEPTLGTHINYKKGERFFRWLLEKIIVETTKLINDSTTYNNYLRQNLPYEKRYGRIKRSDLWQILGTETIRPDISLSPEKIKTLQLAVDEMGKGDIQILPEMTANQFFRICEICYEANDYFKSSAETLTPLEKYLSMADGRDAGLRKIDGDSSEAFYNWFHSGGTIGAHPWEICRGGNSTHISLFASERNGKWGIRLAGSSIVRVEETVRMAVALYDNKIPFELSQAKEIVQMVTGNDFIGIVPETVFPRYCHSLFPDEDNIIDFMNMGRDKEITPKMIEKSYWYPLDKIELAITSVPQKPSVTML